MSDTETHVTVHMVASLDGFIARKDGRVDWLETADTFEGGETLTPEYVQAFLETIDCYVMGSRTYETALSFEEKGLGWAYGDKPTVVLTRRNLPKTSGPPTAGRPRAWSVGLHAWPAGEKTGRRPL